MTSNEESLETSVDDSGSSRLLHDIEEISKALYLHEPPPKTLMPPQDHTTRNPKYLNDNSLPNNKKSSIWKWKPLKALSHIRNHRLSCIFFLHVHSIEGLPINFNDLSLCVYWKRKHEVLRSESIRVKDGVAEFDETLIHRCSVYFSKSDPHDDVAKYEPKLSSLYVLIVGAPNLDLGKHWVDLTRLLPLTLMELEEEKNHHGKWITSFKLTGKARGATINVSFGFSLSRDKFVTSGIVGKTPDKDYETIQNGMLRRVGSIPSNSRRRTHLSSLSLDMKNHNGILPYEGPPITFLYQLLDDQQLSHSTEFGLNEVENGEFTVIDKGIESVKDQFTIEEQNVNSVENSCIETIDVVELFKDDEDDNEVCGDFDDISYKENNDCTEESNIQELELLLQNLSISGSPDRDFSFQANQFLEYDCHTKNGEIYEGGKMVPSCSLDDLTDIVVNDFMNLIGSDSEPESPRERLLRQFEKEALFSGNQDFDLDVKEEEVHGFDIFDSSFLFREAQKEHDDKDHSSLIGRRKAKMLENLETEALMQEWGLNERAFQNSPRTSSGAFGSPVYLSPERLPDLPPLGEGLGSFLMTKSGGFIRSMNPLLFKGAKNGERLIVQVSNSIVLPPAMGFDGLDILLKWATVGAEKMLLQTTRLMPMDDITGKTFQQVLWEARMETEVLQRGQELVHESETKERSTNTCEIDSEYVSLGNIVPSAIVKIQYLLIEGLRIQSGMSNDEPPSRVSVEHIRGNSASTSNSHIKQLVDTSISLDEWIRLRSTSSGIYGANSEEPEHSFAENHRNLGNNFMLSLQLLLRDPLRDYEPVGIPMLALVQVERVSIKSTTSFDPMFKITEVHVTGFTADFGKKQQSGSRWLNSSGMTGKRKRHPLSKSNVLVRSSIRSMKKLKYEETLWSIASYVNGEVAKWKDLSGLSLYTRNPDIVFN